MTKVIQTPRKDAAAAEIDKHRDTCDQCTNGHGCRTGLRLSRQFIAAWDADMDAGGIIHDHRAPKQPCRACMRDKGLT